MRSSSSPHFRTLLLSGLAASLAASGCAISPLTDMDAPPYQSQPAPDPKLRADVPPSARAASASQAVEPSLTKISNRVAAYEEKLQAWQRLSGGPESMNFSSEQVAMLISCRNEAAELHEDYSRLQARLQAKQAAMAPQMLHAFQELKERDIAYLEGACPRLFSTLSAVPTASTGAAQEKMSDQAAVEELPPLSESGQSQIEISSMRTVGKIAEAEPQPTQERQAESEARYEQAAEQLRNGREQEARSLFSSLLDEARQQGDRQLEIKTLRVLADLDFALRNYDSARRRHLELEQLDGSRAMEHLAALEAVGARREELDAYAALLRGSLTYRPEQDGFTTVRQANEFVRLHPDSHLADNAAELGQKAEAEAEQWFGRVLADADRLRTERKQAEALKLLEAVPLDILPLEKQELLRQKKVALGRAEAAEEQIPPAAQEPVVELPNSSAASGLAPQDVWKQGLAALEAEEYERAVSLFSSLNGTQFGLEAERKAEEAARLAGQEERKKAAELFQQAADTADPAAKRQLLLTSKSVLEDILRKYPQAGIEDKVRRNLSRVEQELAALGQPGETR